MDHSILTKDCSDTAKRQNFWIDFKLTAKHSAWDIRLVFDHLKVTKPVLNRAEVEAFEQAYHKLLLILLYDLKLAEHSLRRFDCLVNLALQVLNEHEILGRVLQELILEELEPDAQSFAAWWSNIVSHAVSHSSLHHVKLLRVFVRQAAVGPDHTV